MFEKYTKRLEPGDLGPSQPNQGTQQSASGGQDVPVGRGNRLVDVYI